MTALTQAAVGAMGGAAMMPCLSASGSSAPSTIGDPSPRLMCKAPKRPDPLDEKEWLKFMQAYRAGNWSNWDQEANSEPGAQPAKMRSDCGKVFCNMGNKVDAREYYLKNNFLAPPLLPTDRKRERETALLRHNFMLPQRRESAEKYARHARAVFKADSATITVACAQRNEVLFLAQTGYVSVEAEPPANTLCAHAMLLDETVLCIPDLSKDWRYEGFSPVDAEGQPLHFYASAPIMLTTPDLSGSALRAHRERQNSGIARPMPTGRKIEAGRLTILAREPRHDFTEEDAAMLLTIAEMAAQSFENEALQAQARRTDLIQNSISQLLESLDPSDGSSCDEQPPEEHYPSLAVSSRLCPGRVKVTCDAFRAALETTAAYGLDLTPFRVSRPSAHAHAASGSSFSNGRSSVASPRSGGSASAYPSTPWLSTSGSGLSSNTSSPAPDSSISLFPELGSKSAASDIAAVPSPRSMRRVVSRPGSSAGKAGEVLTTSPGFRPPASPARPTHRPTHPAKHNSTSSFSWAADTSNSATSSGLDDDLVSIDSEDRVELVACSPPEARELDLSSVEAKTAICHYLARLKGRSQVTVHYPWSNDGTETPSEHEDASSQDYFRADPLASILPSDGGTRAYICTAVFDHEKQPLFLLLATFDESRYRSIESADTHFAQGCGVLLYSSVLRQQARLVDQAQLSFVRRVSHELRTPLHAVIGITDFALLQHVEESLRGLLMGIRLAGTNLSTIVDDILELGTISGIRKGAEARVEDVDLLREIEDSCEQELEHQEMEARQSRALDQHTRMDGVPSIVIDFDPSLRQRWRIDRARTKKVLSKILSNALRFNKDRGLVEVSVRPRYAHDVIKEDEESLVDIVISDTGIGMTKNFITKELAKPFTKGDSFQTGVGLGFTIASSLVHHMGGSIDVKSTLGSGTRVAITLPLMPLGTVPPPQSPGSNYQVESVFFSGFEGRDMQRVRELLSDHVMSNGMRLAPSTEQADLVVLAEQSLCQHSEASGACNGAHVLSGVAPPGGPNGRVIVVAATSIGQPRGLGELTSLPIQILKPPFGPSTLATMDQFLSERQPLVMRQPAVPTPHPKEAVADEKVEPVAPPPQAVAQIDPPIAPQACKDALVVETVRSPDEFRVLLVEDNPLNMKLLSTITSRLGYAYEEAHDGAEAVEKFISFRPSVVLLDISLPVQDGFAACVLMRNQDILPTPRIVAVTALSSEADRIRGHEAGMDDWRTKPLSVRTLKADLEVWCREWKQQRANERAAEAAQATPTTSPTPQLPVAA